MTPAGNIGDGSVPDLLLAHPYSDWGAIIPGRCRHMDSFGLICGEPPSRHRQFSAEDRHEDQVRYGLLTAPHAVCGFWWLDFWRGGHRCGLRPGHKKRHVCIARVCRGKKP